MKCEPPQRRVADGGPTPHGVGGLKFAVAGLLVMLGTVPPRTGWVD